VSLRGGFGHKLLKNVVTFQTLTTLGNELTVLRDDHKPLEPGAQCLGLNMKSPLRLMG
jgi:hypothetical protein